MTDQVECAFLKEPSWRKNKNEHFWILVCKHLSASASLKTLVLSLLNIDPATRSMILNKIVGSFELPETLVFSRGLRCNTGNVL